MWIDDLGRLTPFGRTFDVYIQTGFDPEFSYPNGDPRRPYMIGCTRGNESPARSFSWTIEGEMFKNRRPDHLYPWLDNYQECIEYWEIDTGILCPEAGESIGIAFSPIPTSDGCILVRSSLQSIGHLKDHKDAVQET